eukprot:403333499
MKLNLMDELVILYNLTNIKLSFNSFSASDFEVKFDDKQQSVVLDLDEMNFQLTFNYSVIVVPPVFADQGQIDMTVAKIKIFMGLQGQEENGSFRIKIVQFTPTINKEDMTFKAECYSDFSRGVFDEIIFFQDLLVNEFLTIIQSDAQTAPILMNIQGDKTLQNKPRIIRENIQSLRNNRFDLQMYISRAFVQQIANILQQQDILKFYIKEKPDGMRPVYNLFVKALDVEFVNSLMPELTKNASNGYLNMTSPCILRFTVNDIPYLQFKETILKVDSLLKMDILCAKNLPWKVNQTNTVNPYLTHVITVNINQTADIKAMIENTQTVTYNITEYSLTFINVSNSQIGLINTKLLKDSMQIIAELVRVSLNQQYRQGYNVIDTNNFKYAVKFSEYTFKQDYLQVLLNPDIYSFDMMELMRQLLDLEDADLFDYIKSFIFEKILKSIYQWDLINENVISKNRLLNLKQQFNEQGDQRRNANQSIKIVNSQT